MKLEELIADRGPYSRQKQEVFINVLFENTNYFHEEACFSQFRSSISRYFKWVDLDVEDLGKFLGVEVSIFSPILYSEAGKSLLEYMIAAPQYGGYLSFVEGEGPDEFTLCVEPDCPTNAAVHAMRVFANTREEPVGAYLFHSFIKNGCDPDLAFRLALWIGVLSYPGCLRWGNSRAPGHSAATGFPTQTREITRLVNRWKKQRPTGPTLMDKGYTGIAWYAGEFNSTGHRSGKYTSYDSLMEIISKQM